MSLRIRSLARPSLLLAAALSLPACYVGPPPGYHPDGPYESRPRGPRGPVDEIDGFVTFEGRCPTLREHGSEEVYALSGNTRALRPGDHVRLSEREAVGNPCGSDSPALEVIGIDAIWQGEGHRDAYFDARRDGDFGSFLAENHDRGGWYADRYAYMTGNVDRPGRRDRDRTVMATATATTGTPTAATRARRTCRPFRTAARRSGPAAGGAGGPGHGPPGHGPR